MDSFNDIRHKRLKYVIAFLIVCIIAIFSSICSYKVYSSMRTKEVKNQYLNADENNTDLLYSISDSIDFLFDEEIYMKFENSCIGNTNNNLLTFGKYVQRNNIICESGKNTSIIINDDENVISDESSSYINIINNEVFFRNDSDRKIYCYTLKDSKVQCLIDANCGEVIVCTRGIYYIDYVTHFLNFYSFQTHTAEKVTDKRIKSFAVAGESLLVQTCDKDLELVNSEGSTTHIIGDVDSFFYNGTILVQKGGAIYRIKSLTSAERVFEEKENARLIYVEDDFVFLIVDNNKIQRVNIDESGTTDADSNLNQQAIINDTDETVIDTFDDNKVFKYLHPTESGCTITYCPKTDTE